MLYYRNYIAIIFCVDSAVYVCFRHCIVVALFTRVENLCKGGYSPPGPTLILGVGSCDHAMISHGPYWLTTHKGAGIKSDCYAQAV